MTFNELGLSAPLLKALNDKKYVSPTKIQAQAIPEVLEGKDVLANAQTGTGKTAAFALPIIQLLAKEGNPRSQKSIDALIITPTRELALQIDENIEGYTRYVQMNHAVLFGGVKPSTQIRDLKKGVRILVATPGRLLDFVEQKLVSLSDIKILVLDEADRMLDMGFINDVKKILKLVPAKRQTLFFSATMPDKIVELSRDILYRPVKVSVAPVSSTASIIKQYLFYTNRKDKKALLLHILKDERLDQVLIFERTKHGADRLARDLKNKKISAVAIHGNKDQKQRQKALDAFKEGRVRILVATDVVARGIDVKNLQYVINYNIPNIAETYVHRIGRCGRAGEEGTAISICEADENPFIRDIEKLIKQKLTVLQKHPYPQTDIPKTEAEKKEFEKVKMNRRREFFSSRKNNRSKSKV